jgi:hypothetical protein
METLSVKGDKVMVVVSADELSFLLNAINETLEAVDEWEFHTRTGETRSRALEIHAQLQLVLARVKEGNSQS